MSLAASESSGSQVFHDARSRAGSAMSLAASESSGSQVLQDAGGRRGSAASTSGLSSPAPQLRSGPGAGLVSGIQQPSGPTASCI